MLKNEEYTGLIRHKGKLYPGKHKPIITNNLFNKVQIAFRKDNKPRTQKGRNFLYSGLIKCGECGKSITCEMKKKKYIYYHCTGNSGNCDNMKNYVRQEKIDKQIETAIRNINISDDLADYLNKILEESYKELNIMTEEKYNYITKELNQLKTRQQKLLGLYMDGEIEHNVWSENNDLYTEQKIELEKQLKDYKNTDTEFLNKGKKIIELSKRACSLYSQQNDEEKRKMLKILLSNSFLKGEKLTYEYNTPFSFFSAITKNKKKYPGGDSNS